MRHNFKNIWLRDWRDNFTQMSRTHVKTEWAC